MRFTPMTKEEAERYVSYTYPPPDTFYNIPEEFRAETVAELISPVPGNDAYAVSEAGEMIGFFLYTFREGSVELGLGLAPDRTGQGRGRAFVRAGLDFLRQTYPEFTGSVVLRVAEFNLRARRVYESCGFVVYDRQYAVSFTEPVTFLCMRLEASASPSSRTASRD